MYTVTKYSVHTQIPANRDSIENLAARIHNNTGSIQTCVVSLIAK